ncbi:MAG TPA: beta-N-acetylhexosaminidase [Spirochaetia bacterium]|nr:beta-N-acetylhexosaminidase [Spirochaetia bacterium]
MNNNINIIPMPAHIEFSTGQFVLTGRVTIEASAEASNAASQLSALLKGASGLAVETLPTAGTSRASDKRPGEGSVIRMVNAKPGELRHEEYRLEISSNAILITASPDGFVPAVQSLRHMLPAESEGEQAGHQAVALPCLTIADAPRFGWRGLHFDVSRHFFPVEDIKRILDLLCLYKLNRFHWHLTDDQGWRIQIMSHPELTNVGAWRTGKDGNRYGGYYTHDDVRSVLAYAAERNITVIPEIEVPGHAVAAIAAYPHLSCRKEPVEVWTGGGISKEVFCAGKEETFSFVFDVLDEVAELFHSPLIHIGGDECPKDRWKECPECQARIRAEGLKDEEELQSYFIRRVEQHLAKRGKRIVGWDEILEGGLAPDATVMSWRGVEGGIAAARAHHDVIMSPTSHCYFDYRQSANPGELGPSHFSPPVTTVGKVYQFDPIPKELAGEEHKYILGGQANLWTEDVPTLDRAEYMLMPRLAALAEALWSPQSVRDWDSFRARLSAQAGRLDAMGIHYCHILESM